MIRAHSGSATEPSDFVGSPLSTTRVTPSGRSSVGVVTTATTMPALFDARGRYGSVRVSAVALLVAGTVVGWGLVTSAVEGLTWQGYLLGPLGGREGPWAYASLGVLAALVVGSLRDRGPGGGWTLDHYRALSGRGGTDSSPTLVVPVVDALVNSLRVAVDALDDDVDR